MWGHNPSQAHTSHLAGKELHCSSGGITQPLQLTPTAGHWHAKMAATASCLVEFLAHPKNSGMCNICMTSGAYIINKIHWTKQFCCYPLYLKDLSFYPLAYFPHNWAIRNTCTNRVCRQSGFPTFIMAQCHYVRMSATCCWCGDNRTKVKTFVTSAWYHWWRNGLYLICRFARGWQTLLPQLSMEYNFGVLHKIQKYLYITGGGGGGRLISGVKTDACEGCENYYSSYSDLGLFPSNASPSTEEAFKNTTFTPNEVNDLSSHHRLLKTQLCISVPS